MHTQNMCIHKTTDEFLLTLQSVLHLTTMTPVTVAKVYVVLCSHLLRSRWQLQQMKTGSECPECREKAYALACRVRDVFIYIAEFCTAERLLFPFRKATHNAAVDWDDFVEACAITRDPEIHDLLTQVTSHV